MEKKPYFDKKTFVESAGVWVSTVAWHREIGMNRTAETMVFKGNKEKITDWSELDFESLGYKPSKEALIRAHNRMVEKWSKR